MNKLEDVFKEALSHRNTAVSKSEKEQFGLLHGVRVSKDMLTKKIHIYNTTIGGEYYKEISRDEYLNFLNHGWEIGVCYIRMKNYKRKISSLNNLIQVLVNKKKFSDKKYHDYKKARDKYMGYYADAVKQVSLIIKKQEDGNSKNK